MMMIGIVYLACAAVVLVLYDNAPHDQDAIPDDLRARLASRRRFGRL